MDHKIRKNKKSYTFYDMYRECPVLAPYNLYKRILDMMCQIVLEILFERSEGFKMPYGLGTVMVCKYKPKQLSAKSLSVDYKASKDYSKKIYHLNEHSDGYKFRLYWSKLPQTLPHRYRYQLCLVRQNKRKLAQLIFNKHDYINIDDIQLYKM